VFLALLTASPGWAQSGAASPPPTQQAIEDPAATPASGAAARPEARTFVDGDALQPGEDPENHLISPFLKHVVNDQKQLWTSPAQVETKDLKWILPGAGITAAFIASDSWWAKQVPVSHIATSKKVSDYGTYSFLGLSGASFLWGQMKHDDQLSEAGLLAGEAAINATAVAYAFKEVTQRQRPYQGNGHGDFFAGGNSFPSEHSAIAWSVASVWAHEYPGWFSQIGAYGLASAVTTTRVTAKEHFPSDVIIGSALGWYFGRQVYRAHHDAELGGAPWGSVLPEETGDSTRRPENLGSPYVPLDSWIYPAFERLIGLGYIRSAVLDMRPWTRLECARLLDEAHDAMKDDGADPNFEEGREEGRGQDSEAQKIEEALEHEFLEEKGRLNGAPNLGASLDSVYSRVTEISGQPLRDGYHFGQTIVNDYGRPYGEGINNVSGFSMHSVAGPFSAYLQGEYQHAPGSASYSSETQQAIASADRTLPVFNGVGQLDRAHLIDAYVATTFNGVQLSFGKQSLWLGPGESGPLLFSNNADSLMMIKIDSVSPYEVPLLSRLLGPARSEFFIGELSGQQFELDAVTGTVVGPGNVRPQPFLHGTKISFHPTANLEFGFDFTAQFGGPGLPVTWHNFLRTFFSHKATVINDPAKRLSAFDFNYRIPGLRNWVSLYCDSLVIDEYSPVGSTRPAINPGLYFPQIPKLDHLELRLEGVTTDLNVPAHFGDGAFYWDNRYRSGYTNEGSLLGSWVGRMGRGEQLWATYSFSPRSRIQFGIRHNNVDSGFIGGGHFYDWSLATDTTIRRDLSLSAKVQIEPWRFPVLTPLAQSNVTASVGLTFRPRWEKTR
jgi:membrane-associated phospholipid phosphatase